MTNPCNQNLTHSNSAEIVETESRFKPSPLRLKIYEKKITEKYGHKGEHTKLISHSGVVSRVHV
jgi:hypothetical protein